MQIKCNLSTSSSDSAPNVGLYSPLDCIATGQDLNLPSKDIEGPLLTAASKATWAAGPPPAFDTVQLVGRKEWSLFWRHPGRPGPRGSHGKKGADQLGLAGRA